MEKTPLSPKIDFVFRKVFGENMTILSDFLHAALGLSADECQEIKVIDPHILPENLEDKSCVLDLKLFLKNKKVIDIEIQVNSQKFIWKRMQYYTAKMLTEQLKKGDGYAGLPQAIAILIADFEIIRENEIYHHCFRLYDEKAKVHYQDSMEIHFLEIPKLREDDGSQLYNWMRFFAATTKEEFMSVAQTNPAIAEAWGAIVVLSGDERLRAIAESREKAHMDMQSIREEGLQEGLQKGRVDIAKNLLREKIAVEAIAKSTGLSVDEVLSIAAKFSDQ